MAPAREPDPGPMWYSCCQCGHTWQSDRRDVRCPRVVCGSTWMVRSDRFDDLPEMLDDVFFDGLRDDDVIQ
jgi:DNA-directed RNA polymerase subunit RPC12/RpoP